MNEETERKSKYKCKKERRRIIALVFDMPEDTPMPVLLQEGATITRYGKRVRIEKVDIRD